LEHASDEQLGGIMQKVPIDLVKPGMVLAKPILNDKGMALCAEGTELSASIIDRLIKMNITHVTLKGNPIDLGIEIKSKEQRVQDLNTRFSKIKDDPIMDKLRAAIENAILTLDEEDDKGSVSKGGPA
jgi:hypothetical protein